MGPRSRRKPMVRLDLKFHTRQQGAADGRLAHPPNPRSSASIRTRHPHTSARASAGAHQPRRTSRRPLQAPDSHPGFVTLSQECPGTRFARVLWTCFRRYLSAKPLENRLNRANCRRFDSHRLHQALAWGQRGGDLGYTLLFHSAASQRELVWPSGYPSPYERAKSVVDRGV